MADDARAQRTAPPVRPTGNAIRTIVTTVKNEGPFLLEWLAYHRLIGFNRFVVFSNDCTDGTHEILQALDAAGLVHHFDNSEIPEGRSKDPQRRAYGTALHLSEVMESDWVLVVDGDEFFKVNAGDGTLDAMFDEIHGPVDMIAARWRVFGSGGILQYKDRLQIDQFRRAEPSTAFSNMAMLGVKSMFRPGKVVQLSVHRPLFTPAVLSGEEPVRVIASDGSDQTEHFRSKNWGVPRKHLGYDLCQINHYMIRSNEVFLMKRWRGTANSAKADRINFEYYDTFNANHACDDGMEPWVKPVMAEIKRLYAEVPSTKKLHQGAVAAYRKQIDDLKDRLCVEAPDEYRRLFDADVVRAEIADQEAWLAGLPSSRRAAGEPRPEAKAGARRALKPAQAPPTPSPRRAAGADEESLGDDSPDDTAVDAAPGWLSDLRRGPHQRGFYQSFGDYGLHHVDRGAEHLVVSFDNLSSARDNPVDRDSWGYGFIRKNGWSHLGVLAYQPTWFRDEELFAGLRRLADDGFFSRYRSVTMIGTSMGAYGATAFASLAPGCSVVAFSPQSTLKKSLVPWESRYSSGRKADWTGPFADAAAEAHAASKVWLVYDPAVEEDRLHAARYTGDNIMRLHARYADHKTALFLRRADLLSTVVREAVAGTLTVPRFYSLYRRGRALPWYLNGVAHRIAASRRPERLHSYEGILNDLGRPQVARSLAVRFPEIMRLKAEANAG
ncbi:glycosyltransferase family 2 protein [Paracoccus luteus]|uniref:glycosyltransferase family 2 protein n=1 Tax=Paracoccus luteus TaxID=2508543 RepID=UPI00106F6F4C|nr:glycosyltransferase family 2 protein [Paracoccus luteus]